MNISCWNDLAKFISGLTASERIEPVRIVVDDSPIVLAKEICRAEDVYIRPKDEQPKSIGYPRREIEMDFDGRLKVGQWERTMDKGDIFISAY